MALTEAEMDELLYQNTMPVGDEWFAGVSSEGDLDQGWVPATGGSSQGGSSWAQIQAAGFDCGLVDPQMQPGSSEAVGYGGYYGVPQAQQQHLEIPDYPGFNMLGVYQGEVAVQGMYDASSGLGGQGQMGGWQGGYSTGGW